MQGITRLLLITGLLFLAPLPATARGDDTSPENVEPPKALKKLSLEELFDVEVTSVSKKAEPVSRTAAAIHVVTSEDIHRSGPVSIPEALRYIPGVEVARLDARSYAITVRGFQATTANKLLVLMDGRSLYTPLYSGVFWDAQETLLDDVDRIEVIRGPGATVWGANAVNGVINVMTKSAASTQGFLVYAGGGNVERHFEAARYGGTLGAHGFYRVYLRSWDRGPSLRQDGADAGDYTRMRQGGFRSDWTPTTSDAVTIQGDLYNSTADNRASDNTEIAGGNALARWNRKLSSRSSVQVQSYFDRTKRDIPSSFGETLETYDLTAEHRFPLGTRHDVVWGLGFRLMDDHVRNSPGISFQPDHRTDRLYTGFVQDEIALTRDRLSLTLGTKIEHNDYTDYEFQPGLRLAWLVNPGQTLWGAASRAVRTPSRLDTDLFAPSQPPYILAGNPNFKSETLDAFEIGYRAQATKTLATSVSTFYNLYDDLRSLELDPTTVFPITEANKLEGRSYGLETEAEWRALPRMRLRAGYTYFRLLLKKKPTSSDPGSANQEGDSPRNQAFLRSSLDLSSNVKLDASVYFVDRLPNQHLPRRAGSDARLAWQVSPKAELAVVGQNLFGPDHPEFGQPNTRRDFERSVFGKVTCAF
jgi:iron complex outermembrane receptor protein